MDRDTATPAVADLPGERAREWVDYHHESAAPSTYVYEFVWDRTAPAEGPFCTDVDGNVLMDFTSHVAAAPLGYNNPLIMDRLEEFDLVDPLKIAGQDFYAAGGPTPDDGIPGASGLMDRLTDLTSHYDMDTVFLSNSGAEAVENAIKIAYDESDGAKYAITFDGAFHGRTLGALSLNRSKAVYRRDFPEVSGVMEMPYCDDRTCSPETCSCGFFADGVSRLRKKLDPKRGNVHPDDVAYLIMEPIQGEGGYRFPSEAFTDEIAAITDEHDITLIADEIQSGVGRTGEMWGSDHYAYDPDVIASAKGLRVGATVSRSDVFPEETGRLSSTWGAGDLIASAQGALTLDAIEEADLMDNAVVRGRQFKETIRDADLGPVEDVRGKGLLLAVEFDTKERRDAVVENAFERGLLTLACGHKVLRILPPLDVTEREIDLGCDLLAAAIEGAA
ncbi:aminotransferase class-III [Halorubrum distributum JCM 9100]|uniref:Aminotransferase class-III n=6 Tax=Halorubrum distributum TaxID=29283 RepID=M0ERM6_9EURY|nr:MULTISPECIES: aminotransferase class III-fold pyridoxal phosphate-dependent enzyme [Halorubrum distributum group]ELZ32145.1 aminotransferase class-III [Halorubrum terrestre JCM 10247]ELZ49753.1 aminotransferase class-III [Halorubrum distributum JCM 9100]ELZ56903.1 aminotransferase class-III [Halorubrum distributum JCM 10118]EMA58861.1 aminotransferase class-III [Halorubrum litoreum JCM 13561]EMA69450.1 aminotransferase class-III [Halorubrum arcis JCM 13916]